MPNSWTGAGELQDIGDFIKENGTLFSFQKKEYVFRESSYGCYVFVIERGLVKTVRNNEEGKEITTALFTTNDVFGLGALIKEHPFLESAMAIQDCTIYGISTKDFIRFIEHTPKLSITLIKMLTESISVHNEHLLDIAYASVRKKVAHTILQFAQVMELKENDRLLVTRNELASVAGITSETMIRTLNEFKKEGLLDINHRTILLGNLERLKEID